MFSVAKTRALGNEKAAITHSFYSAMASTHEIKAIKYFDLLCLWNGNTVQSFNDYTQKLPPKNIRVFQSICAIAILLINAVRALFLIIVDDPYWNIILGDFSKALGIR